MTFFSNLFGDGPLGTIIFAVIGLAILALVVVFVYRLAMGRGLRAAPGGRARQPRLGIVDAFDLDRQRQLVLVRRDNVEHLIMIGGPNDLLIEPAIVRAQPGAAAEPRREAAQPPLVPAVNGGQDRLAPRLQSYDQPREAEKPPEDLAARDFSAQREPPAPREISPSRDVPAPREMPAPREFPAQRAPSLEAPLPREPASREPPPFSAPLRPPFGPASGGEGGGQAPSLRPTPPPARPVPPPPPRSVTPPPPRPAPPQSRGPMSTPQPSQPGPANPAPSDASPARAPEPAAPPRLSVDIDSLEEEMAKLLGRPASDPKN